MTESATYAPITDPEFPELTTDQKRSFLAICEAMAEGEIVSRIMGRFGLNRRSLYWITESSEDARDWYARARSMQAHAVAEDAIDISDGTDELGRFYDDLGELEAEEVNPDHRRAWLNAFQNARVQRDKMRADNRKWYASKIAPKLYGEKLDITTGGESLTQGVVFLPQPDAALVPPVDGMVIEQTTRVAVGGREHQTSETMAHLLYEFKQGRLNGTPIEQTNGDHGSDDGGEGDE